MKSNTIFFAILVVLLFASVGCSKKNGGAIGDVDVDPTNTTTEVVIVPAGGTFFDLSPSDQQKLIKQRWFEATQPGFTGGGDQENLVGGGDPWSQSANQSGSVSDRGDERIQINGLNLLVADSYRDVQQIKAFVMSPDPADEFNVLMDEKFVSHNVDPSTHEITFAIPGACTIELELIGGDPAPPYVSFFSLVLNSDGTVNHYGRLYSTTNDRNAFTSANGGREVSGATYIIGAELTSYAGALGALNQPDQVIRCQAEEVSGQPATDSVSFEGNDCFFWRLNGITVAEVLGAKYYTPMLLTVTDTTGGVNNVDTVYNNTAYVFKLKTGFNTTVTDTFYVANPYLVQADTVVMSGGQPVEEVLNDVQFSLELPDGNGGTNTAPIGALKSRMAGLTSATVAAKTGSNCQ